MAWSWILLAPTLLLQGGPREVRVVAGGYHTLALGSDGRLWGWGSNRHGQLGDRSTADRPLPFESRPPGGMRIRALAGGEDHSLLLTEDGRVYACGRNDAGQLGTGNTKDSAAWVEVRGVDQVVQVAAGKAHSFALRKDGTVWGWGDTRFGQVAGPGAPLQLRPAPIQGLRGIRHLASGTAHGLALTTEGAVWAWGDGRFPPSPVSGLHGIRALAAGDGFSLALGGDGRVLAWGRNEHGQLGNGTR